MAMKPFAIVTDINKVVRLDVLKQYQNDAKSQQLEKSVFAKEYKENRLVEPLYEPLIMSKLLELNTYHMRACKQKSLDIAGKGWELVAEKDNPSEEQKTKVEEFFNKQDTTIEETFRRAQMDMEAAGYAGVEVVREANSFDGEVQLINHLPAYTLRVHESGNKYCQKWNNNKVWFRDFGYDKDIDKSTGDEKEPNSLDSSKRGTEIFWMINYFPRSTFYGISDIVPAIGAITGDISRRDYNISFFSNYGIPAYLVYITGDFDPGEEDPETKKTPLETAIESKFKELAKNPQSVMILTVPKKDNSMGEVKVELKAISADIKEASFRMYRVDNRDEVITAHGVPPYRLGIFETGQLSGNLGQESTIIYNDSVIIPKQKIYEEFVNFYIFPTLGITDWKWELVSIDTRDEDLEIDRCVKLIISGMMTPNQGIAHVGNRYKLVQTEDNPAMDMHYMNGVPIDAGGFIPEYDITSMLDGLKSKLVEVFIEDVRKRYPKDDDRDRAFQKILAGIQENPKGNNRRGK
jgi:PBSX family phage portal protein